MIKEKLKAYDAIDKKKDEWNKANKKAWGIE